MKTTALIVVAGMAAVATAQQNCFYEWTLADTGNGDGIIEPGESAVLVLWSVMDPEKTGFAESTYDIIGGANWDTGSVDSYDNILSDQSDDGQLQGNNDITNIRSFQLPRFFNPDFIADNPIALYTITWTPNNYSARTVSVSDDNHLFTEIYIDDLGAVVRCESVPGTISFDIVPAPASMALIGLGGLVAGRRRR